MRRLRLGVCFFSSFFFYSFIQRVKMIILVVVTPSWMELVQSHSHSRSVCISPYETGSVNLNGTSTTTYFCSVWFKWENKRWAHFPLANNNSQTEIFLIVYNLMEWWWGQIGSPRKNLSVAAKHLAATFRYELAYFCIGHIRSKKEYSWHACLVSSLTLWLPLLPRFGRPLYLLAHKSINQTNETNKVRQVQISFRAGDHICMYNNEWNRIHFILRDVQTW